MAWLPSHQNLRNHPKLKRAAGLAGVNEVQMIGHLHLLWWWALSYADDGDLSHFDDADIADAADWDDNDGDVSVFVNALIRCGRRGSGFLDPDRHLHDWDQYAGKYAEKRSTAAATNDGARGNHVRWHEKRGVIVDDCPYCNPESPPIPPDDRGDDRGESEPDSQIRGEEIREEERREPERVPQCHDLLPKNAGPSLLEEIETIVAVLVDRHDVQRVSEAVQRLVDDRRRFPWPSDARKALEALLGPVSSEPARPPLEETPGMRLSRLQVQLNIVGDERDREAIQEQIDALIAEHGPFEPCRSRVVNVDGGVIYT